MDIAFYSISGQTRRFAQKTGLTAVEIIESNPFIAMKNPYVLAVPSYDEGMLDAVVDFLQFQRNLTLVQGIAGSGNRNFNNLYLQTAKRISQRFLIPIIFDYEFSGTPADVQNFKKVVRQIELKQNRHFQS